MTTQINNRLLIISNTYFVIYGSGLGRTRYNEHTDIKNEKEDLEKKLKSKELELFIKYLINIGGNTDLSTIVQMIKNMSYNKESLFRILILFEQQVR